MSCSSLHEMCAASRVLKHTISCSTSQSRHDLITQRKRDYKLIIKKRYNQKKGFTKRGYRTYKSPEIQYK